MRYGDTTQPMTDPPPHILTTPCCALRPGNSDSRLQSPLCHPHHRHNAATVLQPLRAAMIAAAASAPESLSEEQRKQLRFQPIALKGHMLELGQALDAYNLDEYVSKSTGETYPGGKVERELEEVGETCDDFLDLLAGKAVEQRKD